MNAESLKVEIARLREHARMVAKLRAEMIEELRIIEREYSDRANMLVELSLKIEGDKNEQT